MFLDSGRRPRSLSVECIHSAGLEGKPNENNNSPTDPDPQGRGPDRSVVLRRAANVRQLLPAELQPYLLPGCFSNSLSSNGAMTTATALTPPESIKSHHHRRRRYHRVVVVRPTYDSHQLRRSTSDPQISTAAPCHLSHAPGNHWEISLAK